MSLKTVEDETPVWCDWPDRHNNPEINKLIRKGDKGILPGDDIGKHHRGEHDPAWHQRGYLPDRGQNPDENYWWNLGHNRQHMQRADLLGNARKAGLLEKTAQKVTGEASMRIDLRTEGHKDANQNERYVQLDPRGARAGNAARKSGGVSGAVLQIKKLRARSLLAADAGP